METMAIENPPGMFPELWEWRDYDRRRQELIDRATDWPVDSYMLAHNLSISAKDLLCDLGDAREWAVQLKERSKLSAVRDIYLPTVSRTEPFPEDSGWFFFREERTLEVRDNEAFILNSSVMVSDTRPTAILEFLVVRPLGEHNDHAFTFAPVGVPYDLAMRAVFDGGLMHRIGDSGWADKPYRHETLLPGEAFNGMFLPLAPLPGLLSAKEEEMIDAVEILKVYEDRLPFELKDAQRRTILDCYFKRQALMSAEVGTGKTIMSLLLIFLIFEMRWKYRDRKTPDNDPLKGFPAGEKEQAVVCVPVQLLNQWRGELELLFPRDPREEMRASHRGEYGVRRLELLKGKVPVTISIVSRHHVEGGFCGSMTSTLHNSSKFDPYVFERHTTLVIDEAHDLSGEDTEFFKRVNEIILCKGDKSTDQVPDHVYLLTATPARNQVRDLNGINRILRKAAFHDPRREGRVSAESSAWMFEARRGFNNRPAYPIGAIARLWDRSSYLAKADCVPPEDLPELRIHPVPVPLARSVRSEYVSALTRSGVMMGTHGKVLTAITNAVTCLLEPKPCSGNLPKDISSGDIKVSPGIREVLSRIEAAAHFRQQSLVISCRSRTLQTLLYWIEATRTRELTTLKGRVSPPPMAQLLTSTCFSASDSAPWPSFIKFGTTPDKFTKGETKVCLMGSNSAQGHSFPLCSNLIFYGVGWNAWAFEQALGRVLRINSRSPVVDVYVIYTPGTIEEVVLDRVRKKLAFTQATSFFLRDISSLVRDCVGVSDGTTDIPSILSHQSGLIPGELEERIPVVENEDLPVFTDIAGSVSRIRSMFS